MKELNKFMLLLRDRSDFLTNCYSDRKEAMPELATKMTVAAMSHEVERTKLLMGQIEKSDRCAAHRINANQTHELCFTMAALFLGLMQSR